MFSQQFDPVARVSALGERAFHACDLAAGGKAWTPASMMAAAYGLIEGKSVAGVRRPWPTLGKRVKNIAAMWVVLYPPAKSGKEAQ